MMILADPNMEKMTPLEACAIEAATYDVNLDNTDYTGKSFYRRRNVFVYLWKKTITSRDPWAYRIARLPGVHVNYLDVTKVIFSYLNLILIIIKHS